MNTLYTHTTPTDRQKGKYKFGQTNRTADVRIKEQARTAMSENPEKVWEGISELSDHDIHKLLTKMGYVHVIREWYGGFTSDDEVVAVMNKIISESSQDTRVEYSPRYFQTVIKDQFLTKYQSELDLGYGKIDFALELAPRFGKTIWAIDLLDTMFKIKGVKMCVIPTYVLTAITSFKKEFYTFKGYSSNMVLVTPEDDMTSIINENYGNKLIVVAMSLHMREHESKLDILKSLPRRDKVSIIDEADFGAHRMNSQGKIDYLNCGLNIYMTGTAIERVASPLSNLRDNIIRWSYTDMLMVKEGEHPIQTGLNSLDESKDSVKDIIVPQFMRLSLGGVVNTFNNIEPEYRSDWNKLFSDVDKAKPVLSNLIKSLFGEYNGRLTYLVDLNTSEICPKDVTMIFAGTPDKKQQNKFHKLIQDSLGPQYIVELINGDETSNREAEEKAKGVVARAQREGKKVVFISKDMGSRSFSVSEIDTVMLMFDRGSYATISQKVSRVLTPGKTYGGNKKVYGNVISLSLDPNREQVNPIDEYLVYEGEKVQVNELSDGIHRVLRSVNIFVNDKGMMEPIVSDEYADKLISSSALIRVGMETVKVDSVINDSDLVKLLIGIEVNNQIEEEKIEGIDSSKVVRTDEEKIKEEKKNQKVIEDLRQKLKEVLSNIVENIVEISEINNCESDNIITTLEMIDEKGYCEEVVFEVGLDCQTVKKIILTGALSEKLLNTIITSYNKEENTGVCNIKMTQHLKWKADSSKGEVFTPIKLVNKILDKIPEEVWKTPESVFLDPCMGKGTFLLEIVRRLVYIYGYTEEDAKSRVYGYDIRVKYINHLTRRGFKNVRHKDFLNEVINMEFDVVLGNPPYQEKVGDKKTEPLWNKFVKKSISLIKKDGFLVFIHPTGWRDVEGKFKNIQEMIKSKKIHYLSLHNEKDSQKIFGVQSCFDWYVLQNTQPNAGFLTTIKCMDDTIVNEEIATMNFIPNGHFNEIKSLIAGPEDENVNLIYSRSDYGTDKPQTSKVQTEEYVYPCVSNVNKDGSLTLYYSNTTNNGHFGIPKLICGKASSGTNFFIDRDGEYGLTQYGFAIVDDSENLEKIKMALTSDKFKILSQSLPRFSQAINHKMINSFRKDFWKEFINE